MNLTDYNEIRAMLSRHGFHFSKSLGQNFLTAAWVPERIAEEAGLDAQTGVVEVGPGIGCLTAALAGRAGKVVAVELDKALLPVLDETLADFSNVTIVPGDATKLDLAALVERELQGLRPVVCANLPYNVTSPLLTALIGSGCFETITVMIQREVARRICAKAGSPDYGAFGLFVQWHCETQLLFDVPPGCFVPQPKVTSSVIRLTRRAAPPVAVSDEKLLFRVIRAAFNQRRKTLVNALSAALPLDKGELEKTLIGCGFDPRVRGESLDIGQFVVITEEILRSKGADL
ncbi:MAG: 16S rRNA (adenine(1518)-N(6)/adenine(1519)-N(6))-dimethyltransferase RsmA [Oscillospiraceae bacterium]|nr:16S rRNA (adenine(1518)-N(6)/adenine(1519)-N(6))-dimethyltransferase RsmA [Oscillospiraceae bacterium]